MGRSTGIEPATSGTTIRAYSSSPVIVNLHKTLQHWEQPHRISSYVAARIHLFPLWCYSGAYPRAGSVVATGKITKRSVEAVPVPPKDSGKREHLWDDSLKGFGVMVTDRGVRSYLVQYRIGGRAGKTRRVTIGKHGSPWTADKARDRAAELLEQVRRKIDPFDAEKAMLAAQLEEKQQQAEATEILSRLAFSTLADSFVEKYAKVRQPKTWKDTDSVVRRDLKPFFGDKPLPQIDHDDIVELLDLVGNAAPARR
jgi:hypothetical protein